MPKAQLDAAPDTERAFFLLAGFVCDEVMLLIRLMLSCMPSDQCGVREQRAQNAQVLILNALLSGVLYEGWCLLRKTWFVDEVFGKEYESQMPEASTNALEIIKKYFGRDNVIKTARNKFAFHLDPGILAAGYRGVPDTEDCAWYVAKDVVNDLHYISHVVAGRALFDNISPGDPGEGVRRLVQETTDVSDAFTLFLHGVMRVFIDRHLKGYTLETEDVKGVPSLSTVRIPYFVRR